MNTSDINKVIEQARAWYGINERDSNFAEIVKVYNEIPGARGPALASYPWCAIFVSAVYWKAIGESRFAEMACDRMIQRLQELGVYSVSGTPQAGDIVFYDWDRNGTSDHVGIVTEVRSDAYIVIEGNKSDSVSYRDVWLDYPYIKGFGFATRLDESKAESVAESSTVGQQMAEKVVAQRWWPTLKIYSKGEWVVVLQSLLNAKGKYGLEVDGDFGPMTYIATNKFQTANSLERDGIVGKETWGELKK